MDSMKRVWYLIQQWLKRHKVDLNLKVEVGLSDETNHVVADGWFTLSRTQLFGLMGLSPKKLYVTGVRWNSVADTLKVTVRGTEIPDCGGEIVSVNPIHTEKELRDGSRSIS